MAKSPRLLQVVVRWVFRASMQCFGRFREGQVGSGLLRSRRQVWDEYVEERQQEASVRAQAAAAVTAALKTEDPFTVSRLIQLEARCGASRTTSNIVYVDITKTARNTTD